MTLAARKHFLQCETGAYVSRSKGNFHKILKLQEGKIHCIQLQQVSRDLNKHITVYAVHVHNTCISWLYHFIGNEI